MKKQTAQAIERGWESLDKELNFKAEIRAEVEAIFRKAQRMGGLDVEDATDKIMYVVGANL